MGSDAESERLGVATALERTRVLESVLHQAILDTHEVSGDPSLDADSAEIERESLLAVNEQLGLLALKLRQYGQLGLHEHTKKTTVLSELDELRRDLITVSYTSQHAIVVAKGALREVRKFAEMRSEIDLSDDDSEDSFSDVRSNIDDSDDVMYLAYTKSPVKKQINLQSRTAAPLPGSLKTSSSATSEQRRELEEALTRAEAALSKTHSGQRRVLDSTAQTQLTQRRMSHTVNQQRSGQTLQTVQEVAVSPQKGHMLRKSSIERSLEKELPERQRQSSCSLDSAANQALQQSSAPEGRQSQQPPRASTCEDVSDASSIGSIATFADSPTKDLSCQLQSKQTDTLCDTTPVSPFKGFGTRRQGSEAETTFDDSACSEDTLQLAAWRPLSSKNEDTHEVMNEHRDGSTHSISSSSSRASHEGDSASSVTSSDNLRISRLNSQPSKVQNAQLSTVATLSKENDVKAQALSAADRALDSLRGRYGKASSIAHSSAGNMTDPSSDDKPVVDDANDTAPMKADVKADDHVDDKTDSATEFNEKAPALPQEANQSAVVTRSAAQHDYGVHAVAPAIARDSLAGQSISSDRTFTSSIASERPYLEAPGLPQRRDRHKAEPQPSRHDTYSDDELIVRGTLHRDDRANRKAKPGKHHKRRVFLGLAAGLVTGAAALVSPALQSPAREEWKREVCERLTRLQTPQQLMSGIRRKGQPASNGSTSKALNSSRAKTSRLFDKYPDEDLGRG